MAVWEFKRENGGRNQDGTTQAIIINLQAWIHPPYPLHDKIHPQMSDNNDLTPLH